MTDKELVRRLKGRRIVDVKLRKFRVGSATHPRPKEWTYDPLFVLDNGSELSFIVAETEHSEYGIRPLLVKVTR